jgi:hypothetical protein
VLEYVVVAEGGRVVVNVVSQAGKGVGRVRATGARRPVNGCLVVRVVRLVPAQDAVHLVDACRKCEVLDFWEGTMTTF